MQSCTVQLQAVGGRPIQLHVHGMVDLEFCIPGSKERYKWPFIIADSWSAHHECIMGMDFLSHEGASIDLAQDTVTFRGKRSSEDSRRPECITGVGDAPMIDQWDPSVLSEGQVPVRLTNDMTLPPGRGIPLFLKPETVMSDGEYYFESVGNLGRGVAIANAIMMMMMVMLKHDIVVYAENYTPQTIRLPSGFVVGWISAIDVSLDGDIETTHLIGTFDLKSGQIRIEGDFDLKRIRDKIPRNSPESRGPEGASVSVLHEPVSGGSTIGVEETRVSSIPPDSCDYVGNGPDVRLDEKRDAMFVRNGGVSGAGTPGGTRLQTSKHLIKAQVGGNPLSSPDQDLSTSAASGETLAGGNCLESGEVDMSGGLSRGVTGSACGDQGLDLPEPVTAVVMADGSEPSISVFNAGGVPSRVLSRLDLPGESVSEETEDGSIRMVYACDLASRDQLLPDDDCDSEVAWGTTHWYGTN